MVVTGVRDVPGACGGSLRESRQPSVALSHDSGIVSSVHAAPVGRPSSPGRLTSSGAAGGTMTFVGHRDVAGWRAVHTIGKLVTEPQSVSQHRRCSGWRTVESSLGHRLRAVAEVVHRAITIWSPHVDLTV